MPETKQLYDLKTWVTWGYMRNTLNWTPDKIAYELELNEKRLIEWVNKSGIEMNTLVSTNPGIVKTYREELEAKYAEPEEKAKKLPNINMEKVVKMHRDGFNLQEMAKKLKVKFEDFRAWWHENLGIINEKIKRA